MRRSLVLVGLALVAVACDPQATVEFHNATDQPIDISDRLYPPGRAGIPQTAGWCDGRPLQPGASLQRRWLGSLWPTRMEVIAFSCTHLPPERSPYETRVERIAREQIFCRIYTLDDIKQEPYRIEIITGVNDCLASSSR